MRDMGTSLRGESGVGARAGEGASLVPGLGGDIFGVNLGVWLQGRLRLLSACLLCPVSHVCMCVCVHARVHVCVCVCAQAW